MVMSDPAREFWSAFIFWDAMRPITAQLLNSLDLARLARLLDKDSDVARALAARQFADYAEGASQRLLFEQEFAPGENGMDDVELNMPAAQPLSTGGGFPAPASTRHV
jgi:hypothetical protein